MSDILGFPWKLQTNFSPRTFICLFFSRAGSPLLLGLFPGLGGGGCSWLRAGLLGAVGPPLQSVGLGHANSAVWLQITFRPIVLKFLWLESAIWVYEFTLHVFLWMLCLLTGSSITIDRCEVCWTIFANKWTVILYLVIKTGLGSVRETGKYSNLDLNWPSPPILQRVENFLDGNPQKSFR